MIIASVRFPLSLATTLVEIKKAFEASSPKYQNVPGLITKHYVFGNDRGGRIYIWESRELAEQLYTAEWKTSITERYGAPPEIEWLDNPVTVDNVAGQILIQSRRPPERRSEQR